ncbi:DUF6153 family protein [Nocardioides aquiterrae]|uniref:Uncharacterized protein n=1 Tax=Nocardioides aquiterrae TaxID=203799 RepID=A0ABP4F5T4_9ACTN
MAAHQARSRVPGNVARWLVLLVALVGLMAMHGLSDHGTGGPAAVPAGAAAPMSGHGHTESAGGGDHGGGPGGGHGGGHGDGHGDAGLVTGLCLAVLVALLPFVAASARARLLRSLTAELRDLATAVGAAIRARARGPSAPDLTLLSVLRC